MESDIWQLKIQALNKQMLNKVNQLYVYVISKYPQEWLLLFEILYKIEDDLNFSELKNKIKNKLISFCNKKEDQAIIIKRCFELIFKS